jgi:hypothetical protein
MWSRVAVLLVCAAVVPLSAHHDPRPTYDERGRLTIEGSLVSLTLRNPHSFLRIAVRPEGSPEVQYSVEWTALDDLRRSGINASTFRPGDRVVITGQPMKGSTDRRLRAMKVTRPSDGLVWAQPMSY